MNMPVEKVLKLSHVNAVRDKAVTGHLQTEHYTKILNSSKSKKDQHGLLAEKAAYSLPKKALRYKIEYSSSSFKGPSELTIRPGQEQRKNAGMFEAEGTGGELPLTFVSKVSLDSKHFFTDFKVLYSNEFFSIGSRKVFVHHYSLLSRSSGRACLSN